MEKELVRSAIYYNKENDSNECITLMVNSNKELGYYVEILILGTEYTKIGRYRAQFNTFNEAERRFMDLLLATFFALKDFPDD